MSRRPPPFLGPLLTMVGLSTVGLSLVARGAEPEQDFFEKKIRPVLVEHCYACHSAEAKSLKGGLRVDHREGLRQGGDSGAAVVPGQLAPSLLLAALAHDGSFYDMPPDRKLPDEILADFRRWVEMGAPDPREAPTSSPAKSGSPISAAGPDFWAYQPIAAARGPVVRMASEARAPLDPFILGPLESRQLAPAPPAGRATLLRRLYYDLIGLPPTLEEIAEFQSVDEEQFEAAYDRLVDRLLARPQFGERWGRHWLDVARFSESSGGGRTLLFPDAWRYRDYVIETTNEDRPFTDFIAEQVAGDLLPATTPAARNRGITATAFLAIGPTNYERQDKDLLEMDVVDEQLETIGRAFLGMTLGCARCHDHKFDPIPTRDYYALAGILRSTRTLIHDNVSRWVDTGLSVPDDQEQALRDHDEKVAALRARLQAAKEALKASGGTSGGQAGSGTNPESAEAAALREQIKQLEKDLKELNDHGPKRPQAMSVREHERRADCPIYIRGNLQTPGSVAPRGFLSVIRTSSTPPIGPEESGRRQLAAWLVDDANPLPARVTANRIWSWLTGQGIVRTVDNFGSTGELPTHPELLDHMALSLRGHGWSVKHLVRDIVRSSTYRRASRGTKELAAADPNNRWWGRMNRRRLDAEAFRDTLLTVAGQLDPRGGGPNIKTGTTIEYGYQFDDTRRSVYTPIFRNELLELFETFDFADPNQAVGRRNESTTATQALFLLNHPFPRAQASLAAQRLLTEPHADDEARTQTAYLWVLGRPPSQAEQAAIREHLKSHEDETAGDRSGEAWTDVFQSLFSSLDLRYLD